MCTNVIGKKRHYLTAGSAALMSSTGFLFELLCGFLDEYAQHKEGGGDKFNRKAG